MEMCGYFMPLEVVVEIFTRLPQHDIINCRKVCKQWSNVFDRNSDFWRLLCLNTGLNTEDKKYFASVSGNDSWAHLYCCHQNWRVGEFVEKTIWFHDFQSERLVDWEDQLDCDFCGSNVFILLSDKIVIYNFEWNIPVVDQIIQIPLQLERSRLMYGLKVNNKYMIHALKSGIVYIYSRDESEKFVLRRTLDMWNRGLGFSCESECQNWLPLEMLSHSNEEYIKSLVETDKSYQQFPITDLHDDKLCITMTYTDYVITYVVCLTAEIFCYIKLPKESNPHMFWPDLFVPLGNDKCDTVIVKLYNLTNLTASDQFKLSDHIKFICALLSVNERFVVLFSLLSDKRMIVWNRSDKACNLIQTEENITSKPILVDKLILVTFYNSARIYNAENCNMLNEIKFYMERQYVINLQFLSSKLLVVVYKDKLIAYFINRGSSQIIANRTNCCPILRGCNLQYFSFLFCHNNHNDSENRDYFRYNSIKICDFGGGV